MAIYNKPDENVFASSARQGEVSNFPDIGRGWGISFDQTGGIPPMEWFNFLFKRTDEKFGYLFQRGLSEWSATQTYPEGALVQYKNLTYKAKIANTNKNPEQANSLDWQRWGFTQSELKSATLTESGVTQLLTSVDSNDETKSATPKSVKMAYDKGVDAKDAADNANNNANGRISKSGDTMTGQLNANSGVNTLARGADGFNHQWQNLTAPYLVDNGNANGNNAYYPFIKGINRNGNTWGTAFSFGYETPDGINKFGRGCIHLIEDNGTQKLWRFEHNGDFNSAGDVRSSSGKSLNNSVQTSDYRSQWGQTGWVKLPNGLILQWGKTPVIHDENSTDIVFPIAFPNKVLNIQLTENQMRTVHNHATHLAALNVTNSKFTFKINSTLPIDSSADWFAIGY